MDFDHFLRDRRPRWQRLAQLLDRVDQRGLPGLRPAEADELFALYRLTSSDLSLVQTRTASPGVTDFLEGLVARAYARLQVPRRARFFRNWWLILRHYFPARLRRQWRPLALSVLTTVFGTLVGYVATVASPPAAEAFLPPEHLRQSPADRVAALEQAERDGHRMISGTGDNAVFTVFLFNNNIRVGVLAFALGITFGVGTTVVLFFNGAMLGSLAALYVLDGKLKFFLAWVGPHGSIELPCVMIAGCAGLWLAGLQLRRDQGTFRTRLRAAKPGLIDLLVGASTLLVIAGAIEGGFSQINEPTISYTFKIIVACILFALLLAYLLWMPARPRPDEADAPAYDPA